MKPITLPGGDLEYAVLAALWELGSASTREVHERVGAPKGLVYTTTAKVLDRLHDKALVSRERSGMAFVYQAKIARDVIDQARANDAVASMLGGDPLPAMAALVSAVEAVDPKLLDELERLVASRRRSGRGS